MANEVTIPNLGYTMTEAKILSWLKSIGDVVEPGEPLLEIETDKVNYSIESPKGGVLRAILFEIGDQVPVGQVVAILGDREEEIDIAAYRLKAKPEVVQDISAAAKKPSNEPPSPAAGARSGDVVASPLAKSVARKKGVDLSEIQGSGRAGRIRLSDVEAYLASIERAKAEGAPSLPPSQSARLAPMTSMRKVIARRLTESVRDIPHISMIAEVDMTEAMRIHRLYNESMKAEDVRISLTDIFLKTVAVSLQAYPRLNSRLRDDKIETREEINVGFAVALDDGLIVPAIERVNEKHLREIARERRDLVERARSGRLTLGEIERGTFTISNLGMYAVVSFTSIISPLQSGIVSIGQIVDRPVVIAGTIAVRPMVNISLSVDHRIIDGAAAAIFLRSLRKSLEHPYLLL